MDFISDNYRTFELSGRGRVVGLGDFLCILSLLFVVIFMEYLERKKKKNNRIFNNITSILILVVSNNEDSLILNRHDSAKDEH